jgi:hypothetical protein
MELSEIIMRFLYLVVLFVTLNSILRMTTPLSGNSLLTISFFGAVLILYATFGTVYDFLLNNELVFQIKGTDAEDEESSSSNGGRVNNTNIHNEMNINNKQNEVNSTNVNHTHKYIQNKVFE